MKQNFLSLMVMTALLGLITQSCKKDQQHIKQERTVTAGGPSGPSGTCGDSTISGVISNNLILRSCKVYKLEGLVYVADSTTLFIEPGTVIKGLKGAPNTPGGGLIVTKGAKIIAAGTVTDPIIFTSNEITPVSGDWCGIVLIGKAPTNHPLPVTIEGVWNPPIDITYGGPRNRNSTDNSGVLKYVRIEYAGYELTVDNEMNGLTLAGVGNATTLDYIEVYRANDDAFQFFGGTVNASHLLAIEPLDDMFDTNNGYVGTISFALGVADRYRADRNKSNGIESENATTGDPWVPFTHPTYQNLTIVGVSSAANASISNGAPSGTGKYGYGAHLRRNTEFVINNSVFLGYNYGLSLDIQSPSTAPNTKTKYDAGISTLTNSYVQAYIEPFVTESFGSTYVPFTPLSITNKGFISTDPNAPIRLNGPFTPLPAGVSKYFPVTLSPVRNVGAFPTGNTTWANGWTIL